MKRKYHYEWAAYTDNLYWGRMLIGKARSQHAADMLGWNAGKGVYLVKRIRVYD